MLNTLDEIQLKSSENASRTCLECWFRSNLQVSDVLVMIQL